MGALTKSMHPLLSSKIVQWTLGGLMGMERTDWSSRSRPIRGITSRKDWESEMYSLSVVDKAISVWSLEHQMMGQLAYSIT